MKSLLSHFSATPKSLGAFALASLAMLASFHCLTQAQAEAVGGCVTLFLAMLVPRRSEGGKDGADADATQA